MKFSRKYTRKYTRNGKTKKSKKGGREYIKRSSSFPIDDKHTSRRPVPRTTTDPHNDTLSLRRAIRTNTNTRQPNNIVQSQANGIQELLIITSR